MAMAELDPIPCGAFSPQPRGRQSRSENKVDVMKPTMDARYFGRDKYYVRIIVTFFTRGMTRDLFYLS
jgi:hypothetical protein